VSAVLALWLLLAGCYGESGKTPEEETTISRPASADKIAFTSDRDGNPEIYVMNSDGTDQTRLTNAPGGDIRPTFSADGTRIAFTSNRDGNPEVYVMNSDGTDQTNLTKTLGEDYGPTFSADGTKIAFTSNQDGNPEIYVMNADGTDQTNLTNEEAAENIAVML